MKKNLLLIAVVCFAGITSITLSNLRAQSQSPAPAQQFPGPGGRPMPPRGRVGMYRRTVQMLNMAKADLERSKDDYDGHRQSAIDACVKAVQELEAVQAAIMAQAQTNAAPAPATAPAPAPSH